MQSFRLRTRLVLVVIIFTSFSSIGTVHADGEIDAGVLQIKGSTLCRSIGSTILIKSIRYKCSVVDRKKVWVKFKPRIVSVEEPPYVAVYREIQDRGKVAESKSYSVNLEWIVSPTIPTAKLAEAKRQIIDALGPWFELGVETDGLRVFILDEFGAATYEAHRLDRPNCIPWLSSDLPFQSTAQIGFTACGLRDGTMIMMLGSQVPRWSNGMVQHEIAHLGQLALSRTGWGARPDSLAYMDNPCWLIETEAILFSDIFATSWVNSHSNSVAYLKKRKISDNLVDSSAWLNFLTKRERWSSSECWEGSYRSFLLLIYERTYLDFGTERVTKWRLASATQDWKTSFQDEFGMSVRDWYVKSLIPYIEAEVG